MKEGPKASKSAAALTQTSCKVQSQAQSMYISVSGRLRTIVGLAVGASVGDAVGRDVGRVVGVLVGSCDSDTLRNYDSER